MMSQQSQINLTIAEMNKILCPKCKKHLRSLIKDRITDQMVDSVIGEPKH